MEWSLQAQHSPASEDGCFISSTPDANGTNFSFPHIDRESERAQRRRHRDHREGARRNQRKCFCCLAPSFTHRREGCLWKTFSWCWLLLAFPLKIIESMLVGHPMIALQRLIKHYHWQFIAGMVYAWCWIMGLIYPIYMYSPGHACPIYTSSALWCASHLFVRLVCAQLDPDRVRLLNWSSRRHQRALYALLPIHISYYAGLCCCMVLVYPMFTTSPRDQVFLSWCTLTPTWRLPNGTIFTLVLIIAQFAALIQVSPPITHKQHRVTHDPYISSPVLTPHVLSTAEIEEDNLLSFDDPNTDKDIVKYLP